MDNLDSNGSGVLRMKVRPRQDKTQPKKQLVTVSVLFISQMNLIILRYLRNGSNNFVDFFSAGVHHYGQLQKPDDTSTGLLNCYFAEGIAKMP